MEVAKPETRLAAKARTVYLDALKVFLTLQVVTFHVTCCLSADASISTNMYFCKDISGTFTYKGCLDRSFIRTVGLPFIQISNSYFMYLFFFLSGLFTPSSLDKKGLHHFLRDRVIRLGLPAAAWYLLLGPLLLMFSVCIVFGRHLSYGQDGSWMVAGPPWFAIVLFYFSVIYAFVHGSDKAQRLKMEFPHVSLFLLVGVALGIINASLGDAPFLVFMTGIKQFVSSATFFWGGIVAKRNGWMEQFEQMPMSTVRFLRVCAGLLVFMIWISVALAFQEPDADGRQLQVLAGVSSVVVSLTLVDTFRRYFTGGCSVLRFMSQASYTVYLIHFWFVTLALWSYALILRACGVATSEVVSAEHAGMAEAGQTQAPLAFLVESEGEGLLWLGWLYVWTTTMLVVWPVAYGIAKLPGLRQIL